MKKTLSNWLLPLSILLCANSSYGQAVPQYSHTSATVSAYSAPLKDATNTKAQYIIPSSAVTPTLPSGNINRIYLRSGATTTTINNISNLLIRLGDSSITAFLTSTNAAFLNKSMDTAYFAANASIPMVTSGKWVAFDLAKPISYTAGQNLLLELSQAGFTSTGFTACLDATQLTGANKYQYGSPAGKNPTVGNGLLDVGFDFVTTNDAGISSIPNYTCGSNSATLPVQISNYGSTAINNVTLSYTVDGGTVTTIPVTTTINALGNGSNSTTINISNLSLPSGSSHVIKAWTSNPNGSADNALNNDTMSVTVYGSMNGTYTIGASGADFATIGAAVTMLNNNGVCGPTTFNIQPGTYNEQLTLNIIPGASASNTVTFRSSTGKPADVTIQTTIPSASNLVNYLFTLNGTSYVTFRGLSFTVNGFVNSTSVYNNAFVLTNGASYDTFDSCKFNLTNAYFATSNNISNGILVYGYACTKVTATNSTFRGGSSGIYYKGVSNAAVADSGYFVNDSFINNYGYGAIAMNFYNNATIRNNYISVDTIATTHYGIYLLTIAATNGRYDVSNNIINESTPFTKTGTHYGINISTGNTTQGYVNNNIVTIGGMATSGQMGGIYLSTVSGVTAVNNVINTATSGNNYGLYSATGTNSKFYNNTVHIIGGGATSYAGYFTGGNTTTLVKNNIFSHNGTTGAALYLGTSSAATSDYNNLYGTTTNLTYIGSVGYPTLTAWRAVSGHPDAHSISYNPGFADSTMPSDLHINLADTSAWAINGRGVQITDDTTDINGNRRSTTLINGAPDLGAYEITPTSVPPLAIASPASPVAGGTQTFTFGGDVVATIAWDAASALPANVSVQQYSGANAPSLAGDHMNFYTAITLPTGTYNYTPNIYYNPTWLGDVAVEANLRMVKRANNIWSIFSGATSLVDVTNEILTAPGVTDFGLFTGSSTLTVTTVDPITGTLNVCPDGTTQLGDITTGGTWSSGTTSVATINSTTGMVTGVAAGTSLITYATSNGYVTATVTVYARPTVTITPATAAICAGGDTALTASGAVTYSWSPSTYTGSGATVRANPGITTTYTVTGTDANTCTNTATRIVTVNAKPTISITPAAAVICKGNDTVLTAGGAVTYVWTPNTNITPGNTATTVRVNPTATATYTLTGTDANGCTNTATRTVTVTNYPTITPALPDNAEVCVGAIVSIRSATSKGVTLSSVDISTATVASNGNVTGVAAGTVNIIASAANGACVTRDTTFVTVHAKPDATITHTTPLAFCEGDSVVLGTATTGLTYSWFSINNPIASTAPTYTATVADMYGVVVTGARNCVDTSDTVTVVVYPLPTPTITRVGQTLSTGTYNSYQWKKDGQPLTNDTSVLYTATQDGAYSVVVTDVNGCSKESDTVMVTIPDNGVASINGNNSNVSIYPNPAHNVVNVKATVPVRVTISSMDGKMLIDGQNATTINISNLPNAMYLIRVYDMNGTTLRNDKLTKVD